MQLIYHSEPFGYDEPTLSGILLDARRCNERDGITGALVCRHDIYLQLLEGPAAKVEATYERIIRDDRHAAPETLVSRHIADRIFADWAMLHDPAKSLIWSREEVSDGAIARASEGDLLTVFEDLAAHVKHGSPQ
ncbi:BLUF domain-containing protein [Aestuariibius insulae]|uniref:BLUF domain-containing protein n=1 Tax=Aestuariibius insulae TaxID=2058287 RepID=UPI00345E3A43